MADKKGNIFKRIGNTFTDVIAELKRVTWPTKDKLAKTSAVVLLVIVFFAIYLTVLGEGGRWALEKVGFFTPVESTVESAESEEAEEPEESESEASESAAASESETTAASESQKAE